MLAPLRARGGVRHRRSRRHGSNGRACHQRGVGGQPHAGANATETGEHDRDEGGEGAAWRDRTVRPRAPGPDRPHARVHILVKLDYDAVANYDGDIPGLAATNPEKTGRKLKQNKDAVDAYTRYVIAYESQVLDRIKARIPTAKVRQSFRTIYGGVAMTLPANRIGDLLSIDGVVAVQQDSLEQPQTVR